MKKKIVSVLLVAVLSVASFTGCGSDETSNDVSKEQVQESEAESTEAPTTEPTEAPTPEPTEAPTTEPTEAPTPEPTEAPTPEPTEAPTTEPTEAPVAEATEVPAETTAEPGTETVVDGDWSTAYTDYFERENIMPENVEMSMNVSQDGLTFGLVVASAEGVTYLNMDFGVVAMDMYADAEKIYTCTKMEGQEDWSYALITSEEDVDGVMSVSDEFVVDTDTFTSCEYHEEVTEDGIVYDVLYVTYEQEDEELEAYCYVNRETQMMSKLVTDTEAGPMAMLINEIDKVEIPEEALNGKEVTTEDIATTMMGVIMVGAMSAMETEQ